ncbi:hypothetical protein pEaSNUABM37_00117 [Erwinia phage pEa_SNUABM_37]|nr:hypothetical protein pEaSNUABM37_00117 [Erwinia phage pEa_SNUABM_37]QXO10587.1 hypothetical protein pEaSNUABM48_00117 [Erwinia phage pEa_SNUABM_48]
MSAKLFWRYATMNAGKSAELIIAAHNYVERKMQRIVIKPAIDTRDELGKVSSRIGLATDAILVNPEDDLFEVICVALRDQPKAMCVFVDEAQFLSAKQVGQLAKVVDIIHLPVIAYGLRSDFQGNLFPGSAALFAAANEMTEIRTVCHCGRRATHVLRYNADGDVVKEGPQVEIGGNDRYEAVCRKHHAGPMGYYD